MKLSWRRFACLFMLIMMVSTPALALDQIVPGAILTDATLLHIGVRWQISDDDNLDATCSVRFRQAGTSTWREGMDLRRSHTGLNGEGGDRPENRFAGTVFFLEPGSTYEIELTLADPDGGGTQQVVTATTATAMTSSPAADEYYVIPGAGGGVGTQADPFRGLQAACDNVAAGAVLNVAAGRYGAFELTASGSETLPIVIRGPVDPHVEANESLWAIVDGAGTDRGVVTLGAYNFETSYLIVENLVIQNGRWGIDAQNTHHILMAGNVVRDIGFGYYNRRDRGWEGNQMLTDNTFIGRTPWPGSGIPSERGIDLRGNGNIVCYNRVRNFGDGVSVQPFTSAYGYANDIYHNDIADIVDDPIEIDYNSCNTRVWRNRVVNGRMGVSLAPVYGGPVYIFRNEFFNLESSAYKMNREPAGLVIVHNTSAKLGNGTSSPAGWQNTFLRNNIIMGTRYVFEEYTLVAGSADDWDYDALQTTDTPFAKWNDVRYQNLDELKDTSGIEAHAVAVSMDDLLDAVLPAVYPEGVVGAYDMRLKNGVEAINAGQFLANINDPFVTDGQPDCGAFEAGDPLPEYGPRAGQFSAPPPGGGNSNPGTSGGSDSGGGGGCFIESIADAQGRW